MSEIASRIEIEIPVITKETRIQLTLTERQAEVLKAILGSVTGPSSGPRGQTDAIYYSLEKLNIGPVGLYKDIVIDGNMSLKGSK